MRIFDKIVVILSVLALSGCLQSHEHISFDTKGAGTLDVEMMIPQGTVALIDTMLGSMVEGMKQMFGEGEEDEKVSLAEQMFANKDDIIKKAEKAGLNIDIKKYTSTKTDDGLTVAYSLGFDNIRKLAQSEIVSTKFDIKTDNAGNWICELKNQEEDIEKSKAEKGQFESFKNSEQFSALDTVIQQQVMSAMKKFLIEFSITMPYRISSASGVFEKRDDHTAGFEFSGNIVEDESLFEKMAEMAKKPSNVIWSPVFSTHTRKQATEMVKPEGAGETAILHLVSGNTVKGEIITQNESFVKMKVHGIAITFYNDEIDRIE